jgi:hypothetical protein
MASPRFLTELIGGSFASIFRFVSSNTTSYFTVRFSTTLWAVMPETPVTLTL